ETPCLNRPQTVQNVEFIGRLTIGDHRMSIRTGSDIRQELIENFAPTIELSIAALLIALAVGLPAGILAALRRRTPIEYGTMIGSLGGISMPVSWLGLPPIY